MAKKNTAGTAPGPRRASTKRTTRNASAAAPADIASVTPVEPIDSAADTGGRSAGAAAYQPTYDDIAQAAYRRYLSRGGSDGRDFEDWIEAERELAGRSGNLDQLPT